MRVVLDFSDGWWFRSGAFGMSEEPTGFCTSGFSGGGRRRSLEPSRLDGPVFRDHLLDFDRARVAAALELRGGVSGCLFSTVS